MIDERDFNMENMSEKEISLKRENDCLKNELQEIKCAFDKRTKEYELQCKEINDFQNKIRFLEGQIEAYQYCLNCRR